ncbi:ABC transporter substrate-binding protein, partial [Xylella fastidiosa subsp. multiplex]|nr:ABC transporter substrate-binding protein [Xylella fastidiosa subsp. multiplex]
CAASHDWAAQLIGSALKRTGGKVDDKEALRKALEAAEFQSVRGEFRYQPNHFPVAGFFRADVAAGADGKVGFVSKGP